MLDFIKRPFDGNPFVDVDGFIAAYPRLYELKATSIGFKDTPLQSVVYRDRMKRKIIFSICYEAHTMDRRCDYIKRIVGRQMIGQSYTLQRYFSRVGICYHPSKSVARSNDLILESQEAVVKDILQTNPLLVVTIDDFHWCQIRAIPSTANAPGKFTSARTTANYAVKLHRDLKPLPPGIGSLNASLLQDVSWIPQVIEGPGSESYAKLRNGEVLSKKMYAYSMATKAASQEDFHIIGSDNNPMKSADDLKPVMDNIEAFLSKVGYPGEDLAHKQSFVLAGDFYVWMYVNKLLRSPKYQALQPHVLAVPDLMHVSLNSQEAILIHAWMLIHPLWIAGYPEIENTTPIKMRPKRRTAMLALAMTAWQECREELLKTYKLAANHPDATPVRKAMIDAILWVFEEAIPLSVDCPYLLASGDLGQIKMCLQRLFPLFTRLEKKNYVNIILFQLALLEKLPAHLSQDVLVSVLFSTFSSEDLEVFHSILRAAIRFYDTNDQVTRKAFLITAMRGEYALKQLAEMTEREFQLRGLPIPTDDHDNDEEDDDEKSSAPLPLEKAMDDVVPRMVSHLKDLFSTLLSFSFDVKGQTGKLSYWSNVPHYNLVVRPPPPPSPNSPLLSPSSPPVQSPPSSSSLPTPGSSPARNANKENPDKIIVTLRESLVAIPLKRQTYVNFGKHVNIVDYQSVPKPSSKSPLGDITNGPAKPSAKAQKTRDFLNTNSLTGDRAGCGCLTDDCKCPSMFQWIAKQSLTNFWKNIVKVPARDVED
ncbi:hypothetical protein DFS34DRAFT_637158 [Phlyctochytrium arcticum]|nr:hypothetical protein DFS34DRAFT_637158 [Phlyctochytrium arcticum]